MTQTHRGHNNTVQTDSYLHCYGRCGSAWAAVLHCCQNLRSAPAAADIHSHHTLDANSSKYSTLSMDRSTKKKTEQINTIYDQDLKILPVTFKRHIYKKGVATENKLTEREREREELGNQRNVLNINIKTYFT